MSDPTAPPDVAADVAIDADLVARLIQAQHPDCAGPVDRFSEGWDNVVFRVGDALLARMPRRALGAQNLERELTWLPRLPDLPLPVPTPVRRGAPGEGYPYGWSLVPYLPGEPVGVGPVDAGALLRFLEALHVPCPEDAPVDAARSMALELRDPAVQERLAQVPAPERRVLAALWRTAVAAPRHRGPRLWCHGDLHPLNLLRRGTTLSAVIDWGDLFGGDPAPDLAAVWMLDVPDGLGAFRDGTPPGRWTRGIGWAVYFAVTLKDATARGASQVFGQVADAAIRRLVDSTADA